MSGLRTARLVVLGVTTWLAGCQLVFPLDGPKDPLVDGGPGDVTGDVPVVEGSCIQGFVDLCPAGDVPALIDLNEALVRVDTTDDPRCAPLESSSQAVCAIVAGDLRIGATTKLLASGDRPLVLVALGAMDIAGDVDVAGHASSGVAPGAGNTICNIATPPLLQGGGAGGSFGRSGGDGGGNVDQATVDGGDATAPANPPALLRGGCAGQDGGATLTAGGTPGRGGLAGGAVYVHAVGALRISGRINASGGAGQGGDGAAAPVTGGGGGGSGGMIVVRGDPIDLAGAALLANGGGGGEGGNNIAPGSAGEEPEVPGAPALGGRGASDNGGDGGDGGYESIDATDGRDAQNVAAGGGGGGSVGFLYMIPFDTDPGGSLSPAPMAPP